MDEQGIPRIKRLDPEVVNRIAAGEVVQRPANAVKELIENCIDAKSTSISILVKNGGLKFLQVKDSGHGIKKDDLPIVCERFTTSKITSFEDLKTIQTYGFRGEALASISHISHLSIVTMTESDTCAWKAAYRDGKLISKNGEQSIVATAGVKGTTITIEDMFYNVSSRLKTLTKPNEEHVRITEVVGKYALHNAGIAFSLKKKDESATDIHTTKSHSKKDVIRLIYGTNISKDLMEIDGKSDRLQFDGYISNVNFAQKKGQFILFINHRLVDCRPLKKAVETAYTPYIPRGTKPFLYFSLILDPRTVDVNIHPTKSEVRFLNQDEIIQYVRDAVVQKLEGTLASRTFATQNLQQTTLVSDSPPINTNNQNVKKKEYQKDKVRTDHRDQTLEAFFEPTNKDDFIEDIENADTDTEIKPTKKPNPKRPREDEEGEQEGKGETTLVVVSKKKAKMKQSDEEDNLKKGKTKDNEKGKDILTQEEHDKPKKAKVKKESKASQSDISQSTPSTQSSQRKPRKPISSTPKKRTKPQLTSILNLLKQVEDVSQENLSKIFKNYSFVGCVSDGLALIQNQTELYLIDVLKLSKELFYQESLHNFAEFESINLSSPAPISSLCMIALDAPGSVWCPEDGPKESISNYVVELLVSRREMLQDYFSLTIDDEGQLLTLPQILPGYVPEIGALATFILRLSTEVDWEEEQTCFETLCREFAEFYSIAPDEDNETKRYWTIEQILFPAFRRRFEVPSTAAEDGSIIRIASLDKLYKVFERC